MDIKSKITDTGDSGGSNLRRAGGATESCGLPCRMLALPGKWPK